MDAQVGARPIPPRRAENMLHRVSAGTSPGIARRPSPRRVSLRGNLLRNLLLPGRPVLSRLLPPGPGLRFLYVRTSVCPSVCQRPAVCVSREPAPRPLCFARDTRDRALSPPVEGPPPRCASTSVFSSYFLLLLLLLLFFFFFSFFLLPLLLPPGAPRFSLLPGASAAHTCSHLSQLDGRCCRCWTWTLRDLTSTHPSPRPVIGSF